MSADRAARVLVVEDDQEIAQVLQRSLRLEGYDVRIAGDGEAALDAAAEDVPGPAGRAEPPPARAPRSARPLGALPPGPPSRAAAGPPRRLRSSDDVPI